MFKFLHAADIHLDSPLVGLERYEGAPVEQLRRATRDALENLVQLAIDEEVAFVLIAGDLYDGNWKDYATGLFFVAQASRLRNEGIDLFVIRGNHDAENKMTRSLRLDNRVMFDAKKPETKLLDEIGVAIHGQSFPQPVVMEDLSVGYPKPVSGYFNIGMLHTCAENPGKHQPYARCTVEGLRNKGYNYWALGHIHGRKELCTDPYIVFPGNIQGRDIGEDGVKGCYVVAVNNKHEVEITFRPLDVMRWEPCPVDATEAADCDEVLDRVQDRLTRLLQKSDGLPLAIRVAITGPCRAHSDLVGHPKKWIANIRALATDVGAGQIWIEQVRLETACHVVDRSSEIDGPLAEVRTVLAELASDTDLLERFREDLGDLARKLPDSIQDGPEAIKPGDPTWLRNLVPQIEPTIVSRLLDRRDVE